MANTTPRKSTSSRSGGSSSKKSTSTSRKKSASRPVRREVTGVVLLVLTLCTAVGYFGVKAILINWLAALLRGLLGYGYWLAAPALLSAAIILLFHHGRPVQLRVTCALLLPVQFGALLHMV